MKITVVCSRCGAIVLLLALLSIGMVQAARADMNRFYFASQQDFGAKRGFYADVENEAAGAGTCRLGTLKLIWGVGDGKEWRFLAVSPKWEYDKVYSLRATVDSSRGAALYLDGKLVSSEEHAAIAPASTPFTAAERPGWASGPAEYRLRQMSLSISIAGLERKITLPAEKPLALDLFDQHSASGISLQDIHVPASAAVEVRATFRLEPYVTDLRALSPFVDKYGQSRHAQWPGKVTEDNQLIQAEEEDVKRDSAWGKPAGYDDFGGYRLAPWHEARTGYYRTAKHDDRWWLISPDGNPTFYTGLCTAPAVAWEKTPVTGREYLFAALPSHDGPNAAELWSRGVWGGDSDVSYAAIHSMNLLLKYSPVGWQAKADAALARRIEAWGFSGLGKWCDQVAHKPKPIMAVLSRAGVPVLTRHPDIFDPNVRTQFKALLKRQIEPRKTDPTLLGWSLGNEYDEIINSAEIEELLAKHPDSRAAKELKAQVPNGDIESMRRKYAEAYYGFIYRTVKEIDPNHLYFGFWIVPGWWENEQDWRLCAPYCDIIGYDRYSETFADANLTRLMRETDKPVLCGEFSFPPDYNGERAYGRYEAASATTDAEAGRKYAKWIADAATNPFCVGVMWFQYRDQPITGRGPGHGDELVSGEHYAFGLVDITDRPKWDLVTQVRTANLGAVGIRLKASGK